MRRGSRIVVLVLASTWIWAAVGAGAARAETIERAFSDTNSAPTPTAALTLLQGQAGVCPARRQAHGRLNLPSLSSALTQALRLLSSHSSSAKLEALLAGSTFADGRAEVTALAGLAKGQPAVALLAFLAAHRRDPGDRLALLDTAVMLSSLGRQPAALALADAAGKGSAAATPEGISLQALVDNARGVALFRLDRFSEAAGQFRSSSALAARFAQPRANLAAALLCLGDAQQAVTPYIESTYVDPVQSERPTSTSPAAANQPPTPETALDLSQGVPAQLPTLKIPQSAEAGAASATRFETLKNDNFAQGEQESIAGDREAGTAALAALQTRTLTGQRDFAVWQLWEHWAEDNPSLDALYARTQADFPAMEALERELGESDQDALDPCVSEFGSAKTSCLKACASTAAGNHAAWLPREVAYNHDQQAFAAALYTYATAIASNLSNPQLIAGITQQARGTMIAVFAGELGEIWNFSSWEAGLTSISEDNCFSPGEPAGVEGSAQTPAANPCPPALKAVKFGLKLGVFSIAINCDAVDVGASDGEPVSPYVSLKYKFSGGDVTAFVGAKAGLPLEPGTEDKSKLSVKGGVYMTWNAEGTMTDVGVKVSGPSLGSSAGSNTVSTSDAAEIKVSLAQYLLPPPS